MEKRGTNESESQEKKNEWKTERILILLIGFLTILFFPFIPVSVYY